VKGIVGTVLKLAVAGVLLVWVLSQIETRDRLVRALPNGQEAEVLASGRIEGDWQGEDWVFLADGGRKLGPDDLGEGEELRPGFFTLLRNIRPAWYVLGIAAWAVLVLIVAWRWQILLGAAGVQTPWRNALRLCFVGYFFNNVMPGLTGGDLVRAVLVTRGMQVHRTRAAMSVLVDRLLGLFSLLLLAGVVLLFLDLPQGQEGPARRLALVRQGVFLILGAAVLGAAVWLSRRGRRWFRIDALLRRLPARELVAKVDGAITVYRERPAAVAAALGLSLFLQVCGILSFWATGRALGAGLGLDQQFVIFPVVQTVSSVPVAPAGWGVGEWLYGKFFQWFGAPYTLGVAASILFRLTTQVGFGLLGGLVWLLARKQVAAAVAEGLEADPSPDRA